MKTTNIRGKEYVEVVERVRIFNELYKNNSIDTELQYHEQYVRCVAIITPDVANPTRFFKAHAEEDRTQGNINKTNATENCETSAVGRALGMMGIGIIDGIASADEVNLAIHKQETVLNASNVPTQAKAPNAPTNTSAVVIRRCEMCGKEFTPDAKYPNSKTCGWKCATDKKNGVAPSVPVKDPVQHVADQFGGRVVDVLSNPDAIPEPIYNDAPAFL